MTASGDNKIVLVVRPTRLDDLVVRHNTIQQAQFYVEHLGADFSDYLAEHRRYHEAVAAAESVLRDFGRVQRLQRRYLANFIFGPEDTVVVLGQDGLVANTLKYLDGQHVVGVNPDPARWDGALLRFTVDDLPRILPQALRRERAVKTVTMAKATLNNGQTLHAVNDLFIGQRSHVSARYKVAVAGHEEQQSSSGIIVSTGLGSTGWLKSVYAGWAAATHTLLECEVAAPRAGAFAWDADYLHYFVREPFPSRTTKAGIVIGRIAHADRMTIVSQMPENGVIFSDGVESDYLEFNSGAQATIGVAEKRGLLAV
jgi:NAD kinase